MIQLCCHGVAIFFAFCSLVAVAAVVSAVSSTSTIPLLFGYFYPIIFSKTDQRDVLAIQKEIPSQFRLNICNIYSGRAAN